MMLSHLGGELGHFVEKHTELARPLEGSEAMITQALQTLIVGAAENCAVLGRYQRGCGRIALLVDPQTRVCG